MVPHPFAFVVLTILAFATILMIFGMKYFSVARQARLRSAGDSAYRALAEKAAAAEAASAAALASLQADLAEMKTKLASVERVLSEV